MSTTKKETEPEDPYKVLGRILKKKPQEKGTTEQPKGGK